MIQAFPCENIETFKGDEAFMRIIPNHARPKFEKSAFIHGANY
jgi:hypothetical protein